MLCHVINHSYASGTPRGRRWAFEQPNATVQAAASPIRPRVRSPGGIFKARRRKIWLLGTTHPKESMYCIYIYNDIYIYYSVFIVYIYIIKYVYILVLYITIYILESNKKKTSQPVMDLHGETIGTSRDGGFKMVARFRFWYGWP